MADQAGKVAVASYAGRRLSGSEGDYDALECSGELGGNVSIAFCAQWAHVDTWGFVLCIAKSRGDNEPTDLIRLFNRGNSTLTFEISHGPRRNYRRVDARGCIRPGVAHQFLCTASVDGHMQIYLDGERIAHSSDGWAPRRMWRNQVWVGQSEDRRHTFQGVIQDLFVWSELKSWQDIPVRPVLRLERVSSSAAWSAASPEVPLAVGDFQGEFGGAFSVAFTAAWDQVNDWSTVICFGRQQEFGEPLDAIRVFGRAGSRTLTFQAMGPGRTIKELMPTAASHPERYTRTFAP